MLWTLDKVARVALLGGVSALLATLFSTLGIASCLLVFPAVWLISAGAYLYMANLNVSVLGKSVVVTGCDSGFGYALALHLDKLGFQVFAGCLQAEGEGAEQLRQEGSSHLHVLQMDVTNQEQLDKAAQQVKDLLPDGEGLWGLVNNAGVCTLGPIEWLSMKGFRKDPEVNVFGLIASTKTFLPLVRRAKGRIVNVASVGGRLALPLMSCYCSSKYAVEGFSDALRQEMHAFGVKVCLVEPGNFGAGTKLFISDAVVDKHLEVMWTALSEEAKRDYGENYRAKVENFIKSFSRTGNKDISTVIDAMTEALIQAHPQARYCPMTLKFYLIIFIYNHFPEEISEYFSLI